MPFEIEKAYFTFDEQDLRRRLAAGAAHQESVLVRSTMYKNDSCPSIRVRSYGARVTLTTKQRVPHSEYEYETELRVDSFENSCALLETLGCRRACSVEKYREIYNMPGLGAEIVIDTLPGLPPYVEIEAPTVGEVDDAAVILGLPYGTTVYPDLYNEIYGVPADRKRDANLTFATVSDVMGALVQKNREQFDAIVCEQAKYIT